MAYNSFPYVNMHELNLDYLLNKSKEVQSNVEAAAGSASAAASSAAAAAGSADASLTYSRNSANSAAASEASAADSAESARIAVAAAGDPVTFTAASQLTNTSKIYVYIGETGTYTYGHWYYYAGGAWIDGGVYGMWATDDTLDPESTNAVQNKVIYNAVSDLQSDIAKNKYLFTVLTKKDFEQGSWSANSKINETIRIRTKDRIPVNEGDIVEIYPNGLYFSFALYESESTTTALQTLLWAGGNEKVQFCAFYTGVLTVTAANAKSYGESTTIVPEDYTATFILRTVNFKSNDYSYYEKISVPLTVDYFENGIFTSNNGMSYTNAVYPWLRTVQNFIDTLPGMKMLEIIPKSGLRAGYLEFAERPNYANEADNSSILVSAVIGAADETVRTAINEDHYYVVQTNTATLAAENLPSVFAYVEPSTAATINIENTIENVEQEIRFWYEGKKLSVMGDSISSYNGISPSGTGYEHFYPAADVQSPDNMWWNVLADKLGMEVLKINANSGSTVTTANSSVIECSATARTSALNDGQTIPDVIICECGLNDFYYNASLGDYDGTSPISDNRSTFKNAYAYMLNSIQTNYPEAEIYCCTITQNLHSGYDTIDNNLQTVVNSGGQRLIDYNNAIKDIARMFGCKIIDMESCGFDLHNLESYTVDSSPNCFHPNVVGQNLMALQAYKDMR